MMLVALYSPKGTHDAKFLSNYGYINVKEPIARSYGVGQVQIYGIGEYAMRIWVKPDQLAKLGITVERDRQCSAIAEHGESGRSGRRRTSRRRARSLRMQCVPKGGSRRRKSLATSSSAKTPMAVWCA